MSTRSISIVIGDGWLRLVDERSRSVELGFNYAQDGSLLEAVNLRDLEREIRKLKPKSKCRFTLALPSRMFLVLPWQGSTAGIDTLDSLKFELETYLPIDAENMAIVEAGGDSQCHLVLDTELTNEFIQRCFDELGIEFEFIVPRNLALVASKDMIGKVCFLVDRHSTDHIRRNKESLDWTYFAEVIDNGTIKTQKTEDAAVLAIESEEQEISSLAELIEKSFGSDFQRSEFERMNFAEQVNSSAGIHSNEGRLAEYLLLAVSIMLLFMAVGFSIRSSRLQQATLQLDRDLRTQYREMFPGERITGPLGRLLDAKLEQAKATNAIVAWSNVVSELLELRNRVIVALPESDQFRITSFDLQQDQVRLVGSADSLEVVDSLRETLQTKGFLVQFEKYALQFSLVITLEASEGE